MTTNERRVFRMRMGLAMLGAVGVIVSAPLRASDDPLRTGYVGVQYPSSPRKVDTSLQPNEVFYYGQEA